MMTRPREVAGGDMGAQACREGLLNKGGGRKCRLGGDVDQTME